MLPLGAKTLVGYQLDWVEEPQGVGFRWVCGRGRGVKLIFTGGHISLSIALKGPNVTLGLYKCNYSLTVKRELGAAAG